MDEGRILRDDRASVAVHFSLFINCVAKISQNWLCAVTKDEGLTVRVGGCVNLIYF
jgi:hypothetical protein